MKLFCCSSKYASSYMTCEDWYMYKSQPFYGLSYTSSDNANGRHKDCRAFTQFISVCACSFSPFLFFGECVSRPGPRNPFYPAESFKHVQTWNVLTRTSVSPKSVNWLLLYGCYPFFVSSKTVKWPLLYGLQTVTARTLTRQRLLSENTIGLCSS